MKKTIYTSLLLLAALSAASSCDIAEFGPRSKGMGSLSVSVTASEALTKASSSDDLLNDARVDIYMADFSGLVRSFKYGETPETIYLPADSYRVDVAAGEAVKDAPARASWDSKSYFGSKEFSVKAGQNTSVQVEAKVCNAVTSISFDKSVDDLFSAGYSLSVGIDGDDATLTYTKANSGAQGYFIISGMDEPSLTWTFTGSLSKDGTTVTKTGKIEGVEQGKLYKMTLRYTIKDGEIQFELLVDYTLDVVDDTIIFEPLSTGLASSTIYEIWAAHATVHADVDESEYPDPSKIAFSYSRDGVNWETSGAERVSEGVYQAKLTGLTPSSEYTYKLVIDGTDIGESKTFTTESAPAVPNGGFENVSKVSGSDYYVFYDPASSDPASKEMWWGSGNGTADVSGSASMGIVITVPDESNKVEGSRSVCCQSKSIIGMLAAGNLFSGKFMGLVGTSGGRVAFGRPWTARPTALKCWVKYSTSTINIIKSTPAGVSVSKSDYDMGMVRVALGTWNYRTYGGSKDSPVLVNTTDVSTIIDYTKDPSTIAFGEAKFVGDASNSTNVWKEVIIPIVYSDENTFPTHIVISCASSYYGDYFTGCDSSKLWIDKMELIYE